MCSMCLPSGWCDVTPKLVGSLTKFITQYFSIVYVLMVLRVVTLILTCSIWIFCTVLQCRCWRLKYCWTWRCMKWQIVTDIACNILPIDTTSYSRKLWLFNRAAVRNLKPLMTVVLTIFTFYFQDCTRPRSLPSSEVSRLTGE